MTASPTGALHPDGDRRAMELSFLPPQFSRHTLATWASLESASPRNRIRKALQPRHDLAYVVPNGFLRPLDFQWALALHIADDEPVPNDWAPPSIWPVVEFIKAAKSCRDDADRGSLANKYPDYYDAIQLAFCDAEYPRSYVEAFLLTGESLAQVARRLAVSEGVIRCFEELFFDFRCCLPHQSLMAHNVIRTHKLIDKDLGAIWRYFAFWYGAPVLDKLVHGPRQVTGPAQFSEFNKARIDWLDLALTVFYLTTPVDAETAPMFNRLHSLQVRDLIRAKQDVTLPVDFDLHIRMSGQAALAVEQHQAGANEGGATHELGASWKSPVLHPDLPHERQGRAGIRGPRVDRRGGRGKRRAAPRRALCEV